MPPGKARRAGAPVELNAGERVKYEGRKPSRTRELPVGRLQFSSGRDGQSAARAQAHAPGGSAKAGFEVGLAKDDTGRVLGLVTGFECMGEPGRAWVIWPAPPRTTLPDQSRTQAG